MSDNNEIFHNTDGEILLQPTIGTVQIITECGIMELEPNYIGVIPKNMKFQVNNIIGPSSGIMFELLNDLSFIIPHKGIIGSNGLANREDFEVVGPYIPNNKLNTKHRIINKCNDI